jgi:glucose-1-phosphate adenylyltransferase
VFGADKFDTRAQRAAELRAGKIPLGIGANTSVRHAIIDRNARVGADCVLHNAARVVEAHRESEGICIRDGILVIMRDAVIPNGTVI